ncbi:hypothetical protein BDZ97DRAFT_1919818 [Flammula alnicola]|nr:hypothetical protein BDZ97DRAFT_1919818 [Flammula alnicola]
MALTWGTSEICTDCSHSRATDSEMCSDSDGLTLPLFTLLLWNLKTAEELEEEDRAAQSAAQELMKALAGANPDPKPDYHSQALTELPEPRLEPEQYLDADSDRLGCDDDCAECVGEAKSLAALMVRSRRLNKLEQKAIPLSEMLDSEDASRGEKFVTGNAYDISDAETDGPESPDNLRNNPCSKLFNSSSNSAACLKALEVCNRRSWAQQQSLQLLQPQVMQPPAPTPLFHYDSAFARPNSMSPPRSQSATPAAIVLPGTPGSVPAQFNSSSEVQAAPSFQLHYGSSYLQEAVLSFQQEE